jgi:hypothetical protein
VIENRVALHGREEPDRHGDGRRQDEGCETQLERGEDVAADDGECRLAEVQRPAEVEPERVAEEDRVLDGQRPVEAQLAPHPLHLAPRRVGRQEERHGIAREAHDDEDDRGDEPEGDQRAEEPLGEEREESAHDYGAPSPCPLPRAGERGKGKGCTKLYARRNLKLKRRISNCWFGFGAHSTYFWSP